MFLSGFFEIPASNLSGSSSFASLELSEFSFSPSELRLFHEDRRQQQQRGFSENLLLLLPPLLFPLLGALS